MEIYSLIRANINKISKIPLAWFRKLFHFCEDNRSQSSKIACLHSHWLRRHTTFSFDTEDFIFLNYCYWVCKPHPNTFFCLIVTFNPSKFFQKCPRSRWLCGHTFFANFPLSHLALWALLDSAKSQNLLILFFSFCCAYKIIILT